MRQVSRSISGLRFKLNFGLWMDVFSRWLVGWLLVLGIALLAVKAMGLHLGWNHHYLWFSAIPIFISAIVVSQFGKFSDIDAAAWLDSKTKAGGRLLATALGAPVGVPVDVDSLAKAAIDVGPVFKRIALPALFVAAAWIIPGAIEGRKVSPEAIEQRAKLVKRRIELARENEVLDELEAMALIDELAKIKQQMEASPEAAMEAVDQMQETLERAVLKKAEELAKEMEKTSQLANAAEDYLMMDKSASKKQIDAAKKKMAEALEEVLKQTDKLAKENKLSEEAKKALQEMMKQAGCNNPSDMSKAAKAMAGKMGKMSPEAMKKIAEALKKMQQKQQEGTGKCSKVMKSSDAKKMLEQLMKECQKSGGG